MRYMLTSLMLVSLISAMESVAVAEEHQALTTVKTANANIQSLIGQKVKAGSKAAAKRDANLKTAVSKLLDLEQMAQDALGRQWAKRTAAEKAEYSKLLTQLVERSYLRQARKHHQYTVTFGNVNKGRKGRMEVESVVHVKTKGRTEQIEVIYTMAKTDQIWEVVDIETDGASTVNTYRSQFRRIIDDQGFEALIKRMRKRLAEGAVDL